MPGRVDVASFPGSPPPWNKARVGAHVLYVVVSLVCLCVVPR